MRQLFIFGLGYCGQALAQVMLSRGWAIVGTVRGKDKAEKLNSLHVGQPFLTLSHEQLSEDRKHTKLVEALQASDAILSTVPPSPAQGDPILRSEGFKAWLQVLGSNRSTPFWVGYLSTTGVYGNLDGGWADESTPTAPSGPRGQRRVDAERDWKNTGLPLHIFRLPGIYGPGRGPIQQVLSGRARRIDKPNHAFCRIHVDDIVAALAQSITHPTAGRIWNLVDDCPADPAEVITYACALLKLPPPPFVPFETAKATMSDMALSFWQDNRRVCNDYMKATLLPELAWPDYKSGLKACLEASAKPQTIAVSQDRQM